MLLSDRITFFLASSSKVTSRVLVLSLPPCVTLMVILKPLWGVVSWGYPSTSLISTMASAPALESR